MYKSLLFIGLALVLLILFALGLWWFLPKNAEPIPVTPVTDPFGPVTGVIEKPYTVRDRVGGEVSTKNFVEGIDPVAAPDGRYYQLYGPVYTTEGFNFSVQYGESNSEFLITLLNEPLGAARLEAEAFLREELGVSNSELCALNTRIVVVGGLNDQYDSYDTLGFSFCAGGAKLP